MIFQLWGRITTPFYEQKHHCNFINHYNLVYIHLHHSNWYNRKVAIVKPSGRGGFINATLSNGSTPRSCSQPQPSPWVGMPRGGDWITHADTPVPTPFMVWTESLSPNEIMITTNNFMYFLILDTHVIVRR